MSTFDNWECEKVENNSVKVEKMVRASNEDLPDKCEEVDFMEELKLVYVDTVDNSERVHVCYFSKEYPGDVWGDDWDDAPYEHNAGLPYKKDYHLIAINVTAPSYGHLNSPYSVEMINKGGVPWLTDEDGNTLYAGASVREFMDFMKTAPCGLYF